MIKDVEKLKQNIVLVVSGILAVMILVLFVMILKKNPDDNVPKTNQTNNGQAQKLFDNYEIINETVEFDVKTVEDGLKNMGTLITQEYYFTQIGEYTDTKEAFIFTSTASFSYSYDGVVTAGIECDDIEIEKDEENKKITITLPYAEIKSIDIDTGSFKKYEEKDGIWNKITLDMYNDSLDKYKQEARSKAIEKDILKKADENASRIIENFVDSLVDETEYTVEYRKVGKR